MSAGRASTPGTALFVLYGPLVWAAHLLATYGGHALLCEFGVRSLGGLPVVPVLLWGATAAALALLGFGLLWPGRVQRPLRAQSGLETENRWVGGMMRLLTLLSLFGVAYSAIAIIMVPSCLQLR